MKTSVLLALLLTLAACASTFHRPPPRLPEPQPAAEIALPRSVK
jgi:hypothetical protein